MMVKNNNILKGLLSFDLLKMSKTLNIIALIFGVIAYKIISRA